ncbi:YceI family protein [Taibaiella chishuiensis]|uniref:YceI-like domain-containing protein n=1 Tax=Taibaiella chishuiensis TaxID=1434707 RepID=A0A2P8D497_9BACT|nr:YceI family protein [Taibaiella chishuiensis]PSK92040.1 YceI-like domain-containing protein [Taibaiella chishuiensis]
MKKIKLLALLILIGSLGVVRAQVLNFKNAAVSFRLEAPAGSLLANNKSLTGSIDIAKGTFQVRVDVQAFRFNSESLPDRINDYTSQRFHLYYMQSEKYPHASYNGTFSSKEVNWNKDGVYKVKTAGSLTIHGVTRQADIPITVYIKNGKSRVESNFMVETKDYAIRLPSSVKALFFQNVDVVVKSDLDKL